MPRSQLSSFLLIVTPAAPRTGRTVRAQFLDVVVSESSTALTIPDVDG
jgi:hypothetical protein